MTPTRMTLRRIGDLLDRIGCLKHPCDLDLLLFFDRHPRAFLIRERLAEYVGYDLTQVEASLKTLITPGLWRWSPHSPPPRPLSVLPRAATLSGGPSPLPATPHTRKDCLTRIQ